MSTAFEFKEFKINQNNQSLKVTTDACVLGAWVSKQLSYCPQHDTKHILDIGCGNGLLSMMLAQNTDCPITGIDINPHAIKLAQLNVVQSRFVHKIRIVEEDVRVYKPDCTFSHIVVNPPFFYNAKMSQSKVIRIAKHQVTLSVKELIVCVKRLLAHDGLGFIMLPYNQLSVLKNCLSVQQLFIEHLLLVGAKQNSCRNKVVVQLRHQPPKKDMISESLFIYDDSAHYSTKFIELLKPFYLYL
ncbi:MAG: methyltransferase [Phycisphaerales bacterium]|nr:methyltransferase [Phycisphaerales bacterium]